MIGGSGDLSSMAYTPGRVIGLSGGSRSTVGTQVSRYGVYRLVWKIIITNFFLIPD